MSNINTHELYLAVLNDCNEKPERSAWKRGVQAYAVEIAETLADRAHEVEPTRAAIEHIALNGARDWSQYSWGAAPSFMTRISPSCFALRPSSSASAAAHSPRTAVKSG